MNKAIHKDAIYKDSLISYRLTKDATDSRRQQASVNSVQARIYDIMTEHCYATRRTPLSITHTPTQSPYRDDRQTNERTFAGFRANNLSRHTIAKLVRCS